MLKQFINGVYRYYWIFIETVKLLKRCIISKIASLLLYTIKTDTEILLTAYYREIEL